ncbi:MAG: hypothetical protein IKJ35_06345 [Clostridia bacterium]|nr:hypothetical protein [Clostridia bacterium]
MMNCYFPDIPKNPNDLRAFVEAEDSRFARELKSLSDRVAASPKLKILGLTGPTCSGKTTAAKRLTASLESAGHRVHTVSLDDFYHDKDVLQKRAEEDPEIEIDYDSEDTIDVALLEEKTRSLLSGFPTQMPRFDFQLGCRCEGDLLDAEEGDVYLFEGIQLLYPKVYAILNDPAYQDIYICASSAIELNGVRFEPNEIRLMRRLVRDFRYRASNPDFTFYLWQSVRENEEKSIFPNVHLCENRIDSTMPYEIGMLKPYLLEILPLVPSDSRFAPNAKEILEKLTGIREIPSEYMMKNSLYKEFI